MITHDENLDHSIDHVNSSIAELHQKIENNLVGITDEVSKGVEEVKDSFKESVGMLNPINHLNQVREEIKENLPSTLAMACAGGVVLGLSLVTQRQKISKILAASGGPVSSLGSLLMQFLVPIMIEKISAQASKYTTAQTPLH